MATQQQIDSFHVFASQQVREGSAHLSLAELFDVWQMQQPSADDFAQSVAAVRAALNDMEEGDTGRPFEEFAADMRRRCEASSH